MIYVFLGDGFEEIEAIAPIDILRRAELNVQVVGVGGPFIRGSHGITVQCDITESQADTSDLEMIVLPGGMPGTLNLERSEVVQEFINYCVKKEIWIGAICAAPSILGHKGLLKGKNAVCFPGFEGELEGARLSQDLVVRDGKIITAKGCGVAVDFGLELVAALKGSQRAEVLKASLQCR